MEGVKGDFYAFFMSVLFRRKTTENDMVSTENDLISTQNDHKKRAF